MNIVFGVKKFEQKEVKSSEAWPNLPVVTVEGVKGSGKSRRVLFNTKAAELLNLEAGAYQQLVFAPIEGDENSNRQLLIANVDSLPVTGDENMEIYKTSKNKVSYNEDTAEKGKALTSSFLCNEIFHFLGHDDSAHVEFVLTAFPEDTIEAFVLGNDPKEEQSKNALENNNESVTVDEVVEEVNKIPSVDEMVDNFQVNNIEVNDAEEVVASNKEENNLESNQGLQRRSLI